jgi:cytoskeletal protein CcmA (bactofilin family)
LMFRDKINKMARNTENPQERSINRIVEGTAFQGDISCESNIRIDGKFEGNLTTSGRLVVGPSGSIDGTVNCQNCDVEGKMKGKVTVEQLFSLKAASAVEGEVFYGQLSIEPGAEMTGTCYMGTKVKDIKQGDRQEAQKEERTA